MNAPKPMYAREPECVHTRLDKVRQPASWCIECSQGPELAAHIEAWSAWLAENPNSPEARWLAAHQ